MRWPIAAVALLATHTLTFAQSPPAEAKPDMRERNVPTNIRSPLPARPKVLVLPSH
jgi:hypothetical protein